MYNVWLSNVETQCSIVKTSKMLSGTLGADQLSGSVDWIEHAMFYRTLVCHCSAGNTTVGPQSSGGAGVSSSGSPFIPRVAFLVSRQNINNSSNQQQQQQPLTRPALRRQPPGGPQQRSRELAPVRERKSLSAPGGIMQLGRARVAILHEMKLLELGCFC